MPTNGKEGDVSSRKRDSGIGGIDSGMGYGHSTSARTGGMNSRGVTNDGRYTSGTNGTMGISRGYDNARSNNSTIPIPVSGVGHDSVLHVSPGVKESNSNLAPYMIDRGGVGPYGGAIPGTGYSTGSGTRTYAAPRENYGLSPYTQNVNEDPSRSGHSEHRAGEIHTASNPKGGLSYSRDTASELGLGPSSCGDNRPYYAGNQDPGNRDYSARGASPSTSQNVAGTAASAASYVGDTAASAATYAGDAAMGAGSYMADTAKSAVSAIKPMETTANAASYVGDTAASAGSFIADTVSAMKPMEKAANAASYVGDTTVNAGSYMVDAAKEMRPMDTAANAASYIADTARSVAPPAGPSSNLPAETTPGIYDRDYSLGDTSGNDSRTYDSSDRAPITQKVADTAVNAASYVADTAKDLAPGIGLTSSTVPSAKSTSGAVPRGYDIGAGIGFGSGNSYNTHQARSRGMPGSFDDSHSNSYNITGMDWGGPKRANSVSYRGGAYLSGHDDAAVRRESPWDVVRDGGNKARTGHQLRRESLDHDRIENDQRERERAIPERMERDMERERMDRERIDRERDDPNQMGAWPERRRSLGERHVITRDKDVATLDPSSQRGPAMPRIYGAGGPGGGTPRDDASLKAERLREELEKEMQETQTEALRLARERDDRGAIGGDHSQKVVSPGQKYSSLVSQDLGPLDSKLEEVGYIPGAFENPRRSEATNAQEARRSNPLGANLELQQAEREREPERSVRRSSMDRHPATDTGHGSGPGGMMTTMRDDPEYRDQKRDDGGYAVASERQREDVQEKIQSQFEGDDDDEIRRKSLLGRAASKVGNLLKT